MNSVNEKSISFTKGGRFIKAGLLVVLVIDAALVIYSKLVAPSISLISLISPLVILLIYTLLTFLLLPILDRLYPRIIKLALLFGLIAGFIYAGEIILEYILLPTDNTNYGYVEYGSLLFVWLLSSLIAAYASKSLRQGILTAVTSAMIASLLWDVVLLIVLYAFHATPQQASVWQAEGEYQDFARSGLKDFYTFTVEDMMGATFYHLLLGPIVAVILGVVGGLLGKLFARTRKIS